MSDYEVKRMIEYLGMISKSLRKIASCMERNALMENEQETEDDEQRSIRDL